MELTNIDKLHELYKLILYNILYGYKNIKDILSLIHPCVQTCSVSPSLRVISSYSSQSKMVYSIKHSQELPADFFLYGRISVNKENRKWS